MTSSSYAQRRLTRQFRDFPDGHHMPPYRKWTAPPAEPDKANRHADIVRRGREPLWAFQSPARSGLGHESLRPMPHANDTASETLQQRRRGTAAGGEDPALPLKPLVERAPAMTARACGKCNSVHARGDGANCSSNDAWAEQYARANAHRIERQRQQLAEHAERIAKASA